MEKGIIYLGILLWGFGCTNTTKEKYKSDRVAEIRFEKINETNTYPIKTIYNHTIFEIFADDLDYNKYEKENVKQEYYNLTDFQGYYSKMIAPMVDSLEIKRIRLDGKDISLHFKTNKKDLYVVDCKKIQSKQGLILFNGRREPIFWKGDQTGELDVFVKDYFK